MRSHPLAFIDIEATGLDPEKHEILEIGLVLANQRISADKKIELTVTEEWGVKVRPERIEDADKESLAVCHYDEAEWVSAVSLKEALAVLSDKTANAIMVGHNVAFDFAFLENGFSRTGIHDKMHYLKLDTLSIAFAKLYSHTEVEKLSLRALCEYLEIKNVRSHSALSDARATYELFEKLMAL